MKQCKNCQHGKWGTLCTRKQTYNKYTGNSEGIMGRELNSDGKCHFYTRNRRLFWCWWIPKVLLLSVILLCGCVHVRQGDFEYWRLGNQQIGEALLTLPDGSELLLEAQKSTIPVLIVTPTGFQLGEAYKLGGE